MDGNNKNNESGGQGDAANNSSEQAAGGTAGTEVTKCTVVELASLAIGSAGKPSRKVLLTCEVPEDIGELIQPGMVWDGRNWLTAEGELVELPEPVAA